MFQARMYVHPDHRRIRRRRRHPGRPPMEGGNISPALAWAGEPVETQSFAPIMDDWDALAGAWHQLGVAEHTGRFERI